MFKRFTDSMRWLHTWAGLVLGWLLFAVFLTGTLAFFQFEITRWMQPELSHPANSATAIGQAQAYLTKHASDSPRWSIGVPTSRESVTTLFWRPADNSGRRFQRATLDGTGNEVSIRDTRGGNFLYRFHFDLHYMPVLWARWLVGIAAMCMLVAIVTGVVIHKKIFKDFFTFKPGSGMRSWLDAHTLSSVLALPFHFMITYTGLVTLMLMYFIWAINLSHGDRNQLFNSINAGISPPEAAGISAPLVDLQAIFDDARHRAHGAEFSFISVINPGDKNGVMELTEAPTRSLISSYQKLVYSTATGELLSDEPVTSAAEQTRRTMINLHAGRFSDWPLRWLYFISGLVGTVMVATGLVLWSKKRAKQYQHAGHKLVHALNFGAIMGLPFAIGCYFVANRLLATTMDNRAEMEIDLFFAGWLLMFVFGVVRNPSAHWRDGALLTATMYLLLPVFSVLSVGKHIGNYRLPDDSPLLYMDIVLIISGLLFYAMAWQQGKKHQRYQMERQPA
ncbi:PepSY-associated TM helix domain-containing protein [Neptunicella sp. SCSIO 80796]|uniref:PepSY-associated TM helix domain-containing protein n=1 Tax=Neptunicella plasticusilytica TaxID=3117012 RepID=UPI003A4D39A1